MPSSSETSATEQDALFARVQRVHQSNRIIHYVKKKKTITLVLIPVQIQNFNKIELESVPINRKFKNIQNDTKHDIVWIVH